jgi:hypothetical protein
MKIMLDSWILIIWSSRYVYFPTSVRGETDHLALMSSIPVSLDAHFIALRGYKKITDCKRGCFYTVSHLSHHWSSLSLSCWHDFRSAAQERRRKNEDQNNHWLIKAKGVVNHWLSFGGTGIHRVFPANNSEMRITMRLLTKKRQTCSWGFKNFPP